MGKGHSSKEYMDQWRAKNQARVKTYSAWSSMIDRCHDKSNDGYDWYGGRGIIVCDRWRESFEAFIEDVGLLPGPGLQIDRIDNSKGYEPGNVRWTDRKTQCRNRRSNRLITVNGVTRTSAEWAEVTGLSRGTIESRIDRDDWTPEEAVSRPCAGYPRVKSKISEETALQIVSDKKTGMSVASIARKHGLSRRSIDRIIGRLHGIS